MPSPKKIFAVDNLVEKLKQAQALILTDYRGLNTPQINDLRQKVKKSGAEYEIIKNTLLNLATKQGQLKIDPDKLTGPTAALWIYEEDPTALKALTAFIAQNEKPEIKIGFWAGEAIDSERVNQLARLPGLDQLRLMFTASLKSPTARLTQVLSANLHKLILILKTQVNQGEGVN